MPQVLFCAHCLAPFTFTGAGVRRGANGELVYQHRDCGGLNELAPDGLNAQGQPKVRVAGKVAAPAKAS